MEKAQNSKKVSIDEQKLSKEEQDLNNELIPVCPKCLSDIEIISIDENQTNEKSNYTMKYRCLRENIINHTSFKEYIQLIKEKKKVILKDKCEKHQSKKFISYCFDCNNHLCEDCLKSGIHVKHVKNNIIKVKPLEEELDIIKEVIKNFKLRLTKIKKEKENKEKEFKELIDKDKKNLKKKLDNIKEKNKINENMELNNDKRKYILDID